jgi:hypothetical protein
MEPTERVTVTLPKEMVESIDRQESDRSRFVAVAVAHELERRRRQDLLRSLRTPHVETAEVADTGLADWAARLPADDEDLVDPSGGTPIQWIEGKGWVEERR